MLESFWKTTERYSLAVKTLQKQHFVGHHFKNGSWQNAMSISPALPTANQADAALCPAGHSRCRGKSKQKPSLSVQNWVAFSSYALTEGTKGSERGAQAQYLIYVCKTVQQRACPRLQVLSATAVGKLIQ